MDQELFLPVSDQRTCPPQLACGVPAEPSALPGYRRTKNFILIKHLDSIVSLPKISNSLCFVKFSISESLTQNAYVLKAYWRWILQLEISV